MKKPTFKSEYRKPFLFVILAVAAVCFLLTYKLGSLVGGLSQGEISSAELAVGWHGIFAHPLNLPLEALRSIVFWIAPDHGQTLTRLPNAFMGGLAIASFSGLIWLWHGPRTAVMSGLLFATSAWTLHVSRLASLDVQYLWAIPTLLLIHIMLHRYGHKALVWYGSLALWCVMLYIPGVLWFVILQVFLQRQLLRKAWKDFTSLRRKFISVLLIAAWLPLLIYNFIRSGQLLMWLGLPQHLDTPLQLLKNFAGVFEHLFIRGPQHPDAWLGKLPILDVFTLLVSCLGIYFYFKHPQASRSKVLAAMFAIGVVLVALNGPVTLSVLVPLLFITAAAGIAYLLHEWLKVFPLNPLARGLGIGIMTLAVAIACFYNLRSYFIAWPHNQTTHAIFRYHR